MRARATCGLFLLAVLPFVQAPDTGAWPPAGVYIVGRDAVTTPVATSRVQPQYPRDALRARIQGFVLMQFIVDPDGSVGPVRVVLSLDRDTGLDDAAVAALKQWHFVAATKDGDPVRALATMAIVFRLGDVAPPLTLPGGFTDPPDASVARTTWIDAAVVGGDATVHFSYPDSWIKTVLPAGTTVLTDPVTFMSAAVGTASAIVAPPPFPMPFNRLQLFVEPAATNVLRRDPTAKILGGGQGTLGHQNLLWIEEATALIDPPTASSDVLSSMHAMADGMHVWDLDVLIGSQAVRLTCTEFSRRGLSAIGAQAALQHDASICAAIAERITVDAK